MATGRRRPGGAGGFPATLLAEPLAGTGIASAAGAGSGPGAGRAAGQPTPLPGAGLAALSQEELGRGGRRRGTAPARSGKVRASLVAAGGRGDGGELG